MSILLVIYLVGLALMLVATRQSKYETTVGELTLGERLSMAVMWPFVCIVALPLGLLFSLWQLVGERGRDD